MIRRPMTDACKKHYQQLHRASGAVLAKSFGRSHADAMSKAHAFVNDLARWISELGARPEGSVLEAALREYQFALLALSIGFYRAAFAALRLSLELVFATVQWSANEREFREWRRGDRDSNWKSLVDHETGVLSKQFVRLFSEELADEAGVYRASAAAVYRECSEYVHGNAQANQSLPEHLAFDEPSFEAWTLKASVVRLCISFVLAARYLSDFDGAARSRLESALLDHLGHSVGVRGLLGAPVEESND